MIGHFRSHFPGTNINESTLLASEYLNHFHELVMLFEAIQSDSSGFSEDLLSWRPLTYEEYFTESGFRDKNLAIGGSTRPTPSPTAKRCLPIAGPRRKAISAVKRQSTLCSAPAD